MRFPHSLGNLGAFARVGIFADEQPLQQLFLLAAVQQALGDGLAELPGGAACAGVYYSNPSIFLALR